MDKSHIDKLAFIEISNKKLLVTLSKGKDVWYIPGGKRETGESDLDALIREIKEELSVFLISETIRLFGVFEAQAHGKPEGVMVRMTCYTGSYKGSLTPAAEIEKIEYFGYSKKEMCSQVDGLIFDDLKTKKLIL